MGQLFWVKLAEPYEGGPNDAASRQRVRDCMRVLRLLEASARQNELTITEHLALEADTEPEEAECDPYEPTEPDAPDTDAKGLFAKVSRHYPIAFLIPEG